MYIQKSGVYEEMFLKNLSKLSLLRNIYSYEVILIVLPTNPLQVRIYYNEFHFFYYFNVSAPLKQTTEILNLVS